MGASFSLFLEEDFLFVVSEGGERVFFLFFLFFFDPDQSPPRPKAVSFRSIHTPPRASLPRCYKKKREKGRRAKQSLLFTFYLEAASLSTATNLSAAPSAKRLNSVGEIRGGAPAVPPSSAALARDAVTIWGFLAFIAASPR